MAANAVGAATVATATASLRSKTATTGLTAANRRDPQSTPDITERVIINLIGDAQSKGRDSPNNIGESLHILYNFPQKQTIKIQ